MECCKRPQKMLSKTGVSRAEIAAHAFECSIGSRGMAARQFKAHDGNAIQNTADGSISCASDDPVRG